MGAKRQKGVQDHVPGKVRYFTYKLIFSDGEIWQDQIAFVHPLSWELKQTRWHKHDPGVYRDLLVKGEARFTDQNGVKHVIGIEEVKRDRVWGGPGGAHKFMA